MPVPPNFNNKIAMDVYNAIREHVIITRDGDGEPDLIAHDDVISVLVGIGEAAGKLLALTDDPNFQAVQFVGGLLTVFNTYMNIRNQTIDQMNNPHAFSKMVM